MKLLHRIAPLSIVLTAYIILPCVCAQVLEPDRSVSLYSSLDARGLLRLADSLISLGQGDSIGDIAELAVKRAEQEFGQADTVYVSALRVLAFHRYCAQDWDAAIRICSRALDISEKLVGPNHPLLCPILQILGNTYGVQKQYDVAIELLRRALSINIKTYDQYRPEVLHNMSDLADKLRVTGEYEEARSLMTQALQIADSICGPDDATTTHFHHRLGFLAMVLGDYCEAETHFTKAAQNAIRFGEVGRRGAAMSLNELGRVYQLLGRLDEADSCLIRADALWQDFKPRSCEYGAMIQNNLGDLYRARGRLTRAERAYLEAYQIRATCEDPDSAQLAEPLTGLGELYTTLERYDDAEDCFLQAIAYREPRYGPYHSFLYYPLKGLGSLYITTGRYEEADSILTRCLKICENSLGSDHLHTAATLKALGESQRSRGNYAEAEPLYLRALGIETEKVGPGNSATAETLYELALLYGSSGNFSEALAGFNHLLESRQAFIEDVFSYTSEEQKFRFLDMYPLLVSPFFSFALMDGSYAAESSALEMLLKGKAIVVETLVAQRELASLCVNSDVIHGLADSLCSVCEEISALTIASSRAVVSHPYESQLDSLYTLKDALEARMSRECGEIQLEFAGRSCDLSTIAAAIPANSVLWEYALYDPYDFEGTGNDGDLSGSPRYLAFTLGDEGGITLTDLGAAGEIDSLIYCSRRLIDEPKMLADARSLAESEKQLSEVTSRLYELIFRPLEQSLSGRSDLLISPDGQLSLLPLEILRCPDGRFAIEKYGISYLSSGRDLLRFKPLFENSNDALIIADPDFDMPPEEIHTFGDGLFGSQGALHSLAPSRGVSECVTDMFAPLPYSRAEADSIVSVLANAGLLRVHTYFGRSALEDVLKTVPVAPRILHLATHGFFCEDLEMQRGSMSENSLLRSGLALSGANVLSGDRSARRSSTEDGILTAFEASGLNLVGTELVSLSACETGIGDIRNGEGVFGFRRAFQHAGAQSMIMSLWKVPDKETCELLSNFYRGWISGVPKKTALRQSMLDVIEIHRERYAVAHPFFWGAFILLGNPN